MSGEFINPNWHVAIIHFPLGLLMVGIVIEVLTIFWKWHTVRAAGRWMILLGTLSAIPVAMAGIYALRDVQMPGPLNPDLRWADVVRQANWDAEKWEFMTDHWINNAIAAGCFLVVTLVWIASTDIWRKRLYWPFLILLLVGAGWMGAGAWHGGEAVYRLGVGVNLPGSTAAAPEGVTEGSVLGMRPLEQTLARYFLAPLQMHMILASLVLPFALIGLVIAIRRWHEPPIPHYDPKIEQPVVVTLAFPRRYWWLGLVAALIAAVFGAWSIMGPINADSLGENIEHIRAHLRLLLHVVFGVSIIVLLLIAALTVRSARRHGGVFITVVVLLFIASALQIWFGVLMVYDSHQGSVFGFGG